MRRINLSIFLFALLAGCTTTSGTNRDTQSQRVAENFCEREGGEVRTRGEGQAARQYCHLVEGRVVEVNQFYRAGGLSID